jgi:ribulose-phosphate 3-epimerase
MEAEIVPAILASCREEFESNLGKVKGLVKRVQVDIVDGVFAETKTILPEILIDYVGWGIDFEVHLMVDKPELWLPRCAKEGVVAVVGQVEMMVDRAGFIADAQFLGLEVGLAYDIKTNLDNLEEVVNDIDKVVLLAVTAGKQGQDFDSGVLKKIQKVRAMSKRVIIEVDGGLNEERIRECLAAEWAEEMIEDELNRSLSGMEFAVGGGLWQSKNVMEKLAKLRRLEIK